MKDRDNFIKKYKNGLIGLFLVIFGVFIVFQVILPQIDQMKIKNSEIESEEKKVDALNKTIDVLAKISDSDLDKYFELTQSALPQFKDILAIYGELSAAAQKNNVTLGDLKINVGPVFARDKSDIKADIENQKATKDSFFGSSVLSFEVSVDGGNEDVRAFSQTLHKSTPVVEIKSINVSRGSGALKANFFYNPFTVTTADTDVPAQTFSKEELDLVKKIEEWVENSKTDDAGNLLNGQIAPSPSPSVSVTVTPSARPTTDPRL